MKVKKTTILLADDHVLFLDGLVEILEKSNHYEVIGTAKNGNEALEVLRSKVVDIAVLDIEMPGLNGLELQKIINDEFPDTKTLILSMYKTTAFIRNVFELGCHGYVLKEHGKEKLIHALDEIVKGEKYFERELMQLLLENYHEEETIQADKLNQEHTVKLTNREKEVLHLIADGRTARQIGKVLFIAPTTVETHRRNLKDKTGCTSTKALVRWAIENNCA